MKTLVMAWRNIWRNKRRTLVTVGAMSLALLVMILYSGLIDGYLKGLEKNILDLEMGDVQVFAPLYQDDPSLYEVIEDPNALVSAIEDKGLNATSRLLGAGLAAAGDNSSGVTFVGVDVKQDAGVSLIYDKVWKGDWLSDDKPKQVVIGKSLAKTLGVKLGDEVVVLSQGWFGSMANELYTVRGILSAIGDNVDRAGVFMTEGAFRELYEMESGAHQIVVRAPEGVELAQTASLVKEVAGGQNVKTWRELMPTMASMLDSTSSMMIVMFLIVYFAIGIVILNAMLMAVFERIREFGVLKAIGFGPGRVLMLVWFESSFQTLLAVFCGAILSIPAMWYLVRDGIDLSWIGGVSIAGIAWDPVWRASATTEVYYGPIITLVAIVSVAVLYPAFKAAWIRPVTAMRQR